MKVSFYIFHLKKGVRYVVTPWCTFTHSCKDWLPNFAYNRKVNCKNKKEKVRQTEVWVVLDLIIRLPTSFAIDWALKTCM